MRSTALKYLTCAMLLSFSAMAQMNTPSGHIFSDNTKDTSVDYSADPKKDFHPHTRIIKRVKLTPEEYTKLTGKKPPSNYQGYREDTTSQEAPVDSGLTASTDTTVSVDSMATLKIPNSADEDSSAGRLTGNSLALAFGSVASLLALLAMFIILIAYNDKKQPHYVTVFFGLVASLAFTAFVLYFAMHSSLCWMIILLILALLTAIVIIYNDSNKKPQPLWLAIALGVLALAGIIALAAVTLTH